MKDEPSGLDAHPAPDRRFLLLHGWQNRRPRAHWQWWLAERLRRDREPVLYPPLPDPERPSLAAWTEVLLAELDQLGEGERVVIAHSLSVLLWIGAAAQVASRAPVDRVLLVAPPSRSLLSRHPEVADFTAVAVDPGALAAAAAATRMVCTDNDPYCPEGAAAALGGVTDDVDLIPGGAHLNVDAGYGPWPAMLEWCRIPSTRLVARAHEASA